MGWVLDDFWPKDNKYFGMSQQSKKNWVQFWQFSQKANLALHKRAAHEGIKHPCRQCDYEATTKGSLDKHKRAIHEGVKYPCRQCNYEATATGDLTKNKRTVYEGVKYNCGQCRQQFS